MSVYTGRGDEGETDLGNATRVSKANPRIEAYGTVDEVNALIGSIRPTGYDDVDGWLRDVQNHLHVVQADLADPGGDADGEEGSNADGPRIREGHVETVEAWIDECDEELEPLGSFVLPTGGESGAALHHARAVCRRAERRTVALAESEAVNPALVTYLNRLSDALFTFARLVNARDGEREESPTY